MLINVNKKINSILSYNHFSKLRTFEENNRNNLYLKINELLLKSCEVI